MASRVHSDESTQDPGVCDNHPDTPAVKTTDGGGAHSLLRFCRACWERYVATRPIVRRG